MKHQRRLIASRKSTIIHEVCRQLAGCEESGDLDDNDSKLRESLLNFDGRCEYCETRAAVTVDHFHPLVRDKKPTGYCNDAWNSVPCCKECNSSKGGKTFDEWFASTTSAYNPCFGATEDKKETVERTWDKFKAYDAAFRTRATRSPSLDEEWWSYTVKEIDTFLGKLQARVDEYFAFRRKTSGYISSHNLSVDVWSTESADTVCPFKNETTNHRL